MALLDNYFDIPCSLELVVSRSSGDINNCEEKNCQTQNERGQVSGKSDLSENPRNTMHHIKCRKLLSFLSSPLKRFGKHCEIFNSRILAVCFFGRAYSVAVKRMMCAYSPCCLAQVEFPSCMYLFLQSTSVV